MEDLFLVPAIIALIRNNVKEPSSGYWYDD